MDTLSARPRRRATRPAGSPVSDSAGVESGRVESVASDVDEVEQVLPEPDSSDADSPATSSRRPSRRVVGWGAFVVVALVLAGIACWIALLDHRTGEDSAQRDRLLAGARQTALNMTTLQASSAQADVDRILAGASGDFLAQFTDRQSDFVDVVGQAGVDSTGTVVAAGIESTDGDCATALVAADAQVANVDQTEPTPRSFRFRITVCEADGAVTANSVEFVA